MATARHVSPYADNFSAKIIALKKPPKQGWFFVSRILAIVCAESAQHPWA